MKFVKFIFIYLSRDQNWFEPLEHAASTIDSITAGALMS